MDCWLEQSTAGKVLIGPFVDVTDPATRLTGLNLLYTDIKISKNGGAFSSKNDTTKPAHLGNGYFDCVVDATDTGTLGKLSIVVNESTAFPVRHDFQVVPNNVWDSLIGGTAYLQTTSITGDGAYSVAITVDDGSDTLENATVRMKASAGNDNVGSTDANGQVTFSLDAATYTVTITLSGYSFTSTTLAVSGAASQTYSMTAVTITPSTGSQTTCYTTCYDEDGVVESGVTVYCVVRDSAYHDTGILMDATERSETSAANGVVQFSGLFKGVTYGFRRGTSANELLVKIPTDAGTTYELPSFYGGP